MSLLDVSPDVLYGAAYLSPAEVSALDAIHVATALLLGNALGAFFTYDRGQTEMARGCGLSVQSPGT